MNSASKQVTIPKSPETLQSQLQIQKIEPVRLEVHPRHQKVVVRNMRTGQFAKKH